MHLCTHIHSYIATIIAIRILNDIHTYIYTYAYVPQRFLIVELSDDFATVYHTKI